MYGSYSSSDIDDWQKFPQVANVLTSSLFGAWLMRRDENRDKSLHLEERKQGEWIEYEKLTDNGGYIWKKCSCCSEDMQGVESKFCPNCGADMRGNENE